MLLSLNVRILCWCCVSRGVGMAFSSSSQFWPVCLWCQCGGGVFKSEPIHSTLLQVSSSEDVGALPPAILKCSNCLVIKSHSHPIHFVWSKHNFFLWGSGCNFRSPGECVSSSLCVTSIYFITTEADNSPGRGGINTDKYTKLMLKRLVMEEEIDFNITISILCILLEC